ncbi:MAG: hypothetical protein M3335_03460 [Actinomycetota bacterium]|nr:hypothetical protein [Actinomycetota bacterium]
MSSAVVFGALRRHGLTLLLSTLMTLGFALLYSSFSPNTAAADDWCSPYCAEEEHEQETRDQEESDIWWRYNLEIDITGLGAVQSNGETPYGPLYCESHVPWGYGCEMRIREGSVFFLSAVPGPGMTFFGWEGACSGTGACELVMDEDRWLRAKIDDGLPPAVPTIVTPAKGEIVQQPAGSGVVVNFNASGDTATRTFLCRLNTSDYRVCWSPWTTRHLKPGPHTVRVKARDGAGNISTPATRRFTVVE